MGRKGLIASAGSVVMAFLATQHHNLHMMLVALGLGTAGLSFLTSPLVRYAMYALSVAAVGVTVQQLRRHWHSLPLRIAGVGSILLTAGLLAWSVTQSGF